MVQYSKLAELFCLSLGLPDLLERKVSTLRIGMGRMDARFWAEGTLRSQWMVGFKIFKDLSNILDDSLLRRK